MSILETFYILFKSDAKDVKKGAKEAEKSTKELNKTLERADKKTESVGKSFLNLSHSAVNAFGSIASVGAVFATLRNTIAGVDELGTVSRLLNVNVEDLDAWGHAVQRSGGNAKQFQSTVSSLSKTLNTTPSTALKALPAIADSISRMNQAQADSFGKYLGIDQATIRFLQQGRGEVERLIKKQKGLGLVTKEYTQITSKFSNAVYDLKRAFTDISRQFALPFLPKITKAFDYLIEHKDLIKGAFIAIGTGLAAFALNGAKANPYILALTAAITAFSYAYEHLDDIKSKGGEIFGDISKNIEKSVDKMKKFGRSLPYGLQKATGFNALAEAKDRPVPKPSDHSFSFKRFFERMTGKNALAPANVNVGDVTINTKATDGQEIAQTFTQELMQQLTQANTNFDNGVSI